MRLQSARSLFVVLVVASACSSREERSRAPLAEVAAPRLVRLLELPGLAVDRSSWDPVSIVAAPTAGLTPVRPQQLPASAPDAIVVEGTPCVPFAIAPETSYLVELSSVARAPAADGAAAQAPQLVALELERMPSAPAEIESLVRRVADRTQFVLAAHAAPVEAGFGRATLRLQATGRTRGMLVAAMGVGPAPRLIVYELPLGRRLALESPERVRGVSSIGEHRRALLAPPATQVSIPIDLPASPCELRFGYGVLDERRAGAGSTPIRFRVELEHGDETIEVFSREHVAASGPTSRTWQEAVCHLPAVAGRARLILSTSADLPCEDVAAFAEPRLVPLMPRPPRPPDVVLISLDTLRADRLGCYGYVRRDGLATSPQLDAFARRSLRFANARALAPWTLPSHATMFTGLAPPVHRVTRAGRRLVPGRHPLLAAELAAAGYATAAFTAGGFVGPEHGFAAGFDRYTFIDPCVADVLVDNALGARRGDPQLNEALRPRFGLEEMFRWLDAERDRPCFLFFHTYVIHNYTATDALERAFAPQLAGEPLPTRNIRDIDARMLAQGEEFPQQVLAGMRDLYDATIAAVDSQLGELFDWLASSGRLDRTVVAIVSDHGEEHGEHGGFAHGISLYEEQLRVPFLLHVPGVAPKVVTEPVDLADLAPTLRELAGLPPVEPCDGVSVLARLREQRFQETFWAQVSCWGRERALRVGRMKLITRPPGLPDNALRRKVRPVAWELYDLAADPGERKNLLEPTTDDAPLAARDDLPEAWRAIARRFEAEAADWRERGAALVPQPTAIESPLAAEMRDRLEELGYADAGPDYDE